MSTKRRGEDAEVNIMWFDSLGEISTFSTPH